MKFSVWPNPSRTPIEVLYLARLADDPNGIGPGIGWHCIWYADHYMPNTGDESFAPGDVHECWTLLPAIAATTTRVRLGSLVAPTSVHHPALLANRAATLDQLSNGRFTLGLGAGWQINEHHAYGFDLEAPGTRVSRFEESIQVVRSMLADDRTDFHGTFYEITDAPCDPKPVQTPLPIVVGTGSPRMLKITAMYAQEWNTWGAPELAGERRRVFIEACSSAGTDPATMRTSVQAMIFMTTDQSTIDKAMAHDMGDRSIAGSDDYIVEQIGRYAEQGFDEVIVPDFTLGASPEARLEAHRRFAGNIAAQLA
jgi:alkanesulfonate monooxygenase SsuD/methylene tetrahydromethanopterin reductase-like flavin-dependent oxidoreductase (luciferase family)